MQQPTIDPIHQSHSSSFYKIVKNGLPLQPYFFAIPLVLQSGYPPQYSGESILRVIQVTSESPNLMTFSKCLHHVTLLTISSFLIMLSFLDSVTGFSFFMLLNQIESPPSGFSSLFFDFLNVDSPQNFGPQQVYFLSIHSNTSLNVFIYWHDTGPGIKKHARCLDQQFRTCHFIETLRFFPNLRSYLCGKL